MVLRWLAWSEHTLAGRDEHTDAVSRATWHLQAAGRKRWLVRPCEAAWRAEAAQCAPLSQLPPAHDACWQERLELVCEAGDVLVLSTRMWFHHTQLPPARHAQERISLSYARDFTFTADGEVASSGEESDVDMSNRIGVYAKADIAAGMVVFDENDAPDAELPRAVDANCLVVWDEEGCGAVVALRDIAVGEFITVMPSSDEEEDAHEGVEGAEAMNLEA